MTIRKDLAIMVGDRRVRQRTMAEMAVLIDPCTDPATGFRRRLDEVSRRD